MSVRDRAKRVRAAGIAALLAIGSGACDNEGMVSSIIDKPLDPTETAQLLDVLGQVTFTIPSSTGTPCPQDGTIVFGTVEETTGTGTSGEDLELHSTTLILAGCEGLSENGTPFMLEGDIETTITVVVDEGVPLSFSGEHAGMIEWSIGARTGTCVVDLATGPTITGASTVPVEGTLCSRSQDTSVDIE